jgi:diacylglycerol O-acyltransferase
MKRLSLLDACLLNMESVETPMHVGALLTFKLPAKAGPDYLSQLFARLRGYPVSRPPFNYVLAQGLLSRLAPAWEITQDIDLDYHLRHSALPRPGGERELGMLISRLHSHPLDLSRPPWECHVIEGLENQRFAIYFKGHHAAVDGMGGLRIIKGWLSEDAALANQPPPWALPVPINLRLPSQGPLAPLQRWIGRARAQLRALPELYTSLARAAQEYPNGSVHALFKAPHSTLNANIGGQRRFATQNLRMARFKKLAEASGASVNDVVLAVVGGALRRYLLELEALPRLSLVSMVPVALRPKRGRVSGNSMTALIVDLETQMADPTARLNAINTSTLAGKRHVQRMSRAALAQYSLLLMAPLTLSQITRSATKLPPLFNLIVSNVQASKQKLYFDGAELEGMFPLSVLFRGQALNVTVLGYADTLTFSFTACRGAVPSVQRLAVHAGEALNELEQALGITDTSTLRVVSIHSAPRARNRFAASTDGT